MCTADTPLLSQTTLIEYEPTILTLAGVFFQITSLSLWWSSFCGLSHSPLCLQKGRLTLDLLISPPFLPQVNGEVSLPSPKQRSWENRQVSPDQLQT